MNHVSKSVKYSQNNILVRNLKMFEEVENTESEVKMQ